MNGEIISVGTEILIGDTLNTNAQYISRQLASIGFSVLYHTTVGDNPNRLKKTFENSIERSDVVIVTGGLGPTQDDLTKETLAKVFGVNMVFSQESYDNIIERFKRIGIKEISQNNYKQAYIPEGAKVIPNPNGTAPGIFMEKEGKCVILLPGPPREMIPMFEDSVLPKLMAMSDIKFFSNYYKIASIGESALEEMLIDLIDGQTNPTIATYAKPGEVMLRVTANGKTKEEAYPLLEKYDIIIKERLGDNIYAFEDISLHEMVIKQLKEKDLTIAVAESCTGGRIASKFTEIAGVSEVFHSGLVCYSNEAKQEFLGVNKKTLEQYGAVSQETAREMLEGLKDKTNADIVLATTGIAGPGGGSEEKPVGLVYIGIMYKDKINIERHLFNGNRDAIQSRATSTAFNLVRKTIS